MLKLSIYLNKRVFAMFMLIQISVGREQSIDSAEIPVFAKLFSYFTLSSLGKIIQHTTITGQIMKVSRTMRFIILYLK